MDRLSVSRGKIMKYVDEFRDPGQAKKILKAIAKLCSEIKLAEDRPHSQQYEYNYQSQNGVKHKQGSQVHEQNLILHCKNK
jgi:hypothetical protein